MASSSKPRWVYDVFLNFRGTDLRNNFLGHLYKALDQNGIYTFIDSEELRKGDQISPTLMKAIKESCIAIIVFSNDYASSRWCLEELVKIMECKEQMDLTVLPVFYKVDPREVRGGKENYGRALAEHEFKYGKDSEKVQRWKKALFDAGSLSGWHLNEGDESELIQSIVKKISTQLDRTPLHVAKHPIGIDSRVVKLKSMSKLESDEDVVIVGLWGKGGIGKTTLAKAFYNAVFRQFEGSCFLANVREASQDCRGLVTLQELLLNDILLPQQRLEVSNMDGGINLIQRRLRRKKILLILDDVDNLRQLNALAGDGEWFGKGSRIIITTRDKQLLTCLGIEQDHVHEVKALDDGEARKLLTKHAFPTHRILKIRTDLVDSVLSHAKGLPLALEVLGSFLCGRREQVWESTLRKLYRIPNKTVNDVLKISYDGLEENEKEIFLHVACFFKGWTKEYIKKVLDSCDFEAVVGLEILIEKSLISFENGILEMHDLIQFLGMDIVNQECRDDPRRRSRLWSHDDVLNVLSSNMVDCAVKAIVLKTPELKDIYIGPNTFTKMRRLRLLIVRKVHNSYQGPICLPSDLRWFEWFGSAPWIPEFPSGPKKLVGLDMSKCSIMVGPKQFKDFQNLKFINFRSCESLVRMPDLSCTPTLEELDVSNCKNLIEAHESIARHDKLRVLNLGGCSELSIFPNVLLSKSLRDLNIHDCTKFERLPDIPHKLEGLKKLCLRGTAIKELPASIENLVSLENMELGNCKNLASLPSSIYRLQNIDHLELRGCTNLIGFPEYENSADLLMRAGPSNLRRLSLDGCNLSEVEFLDNLSCFPFLRELHLDGNNITSLPTSINKRDRLSLLNVTNCHRLQEIPELPPFLSVFWADNCESLQETGDLTSLNDFVRRGMNMADITSLDQDSNYSTFLPGGKMPMGIRSVEERSASFMASKDLYDKFLGFAFCFVLGHHTKEAMFEILPHINGKRLQYPIHALFPLDSDHMWLEFVTPYKLWGEVNFGEIDESYVQFSLTVNGETVKNWGFRIICKQLEDDPKVLLLDNQLIDPALLYEVGHESTNLEAESSLMHEDNSMDLQDCQMSTEKHGQAVSKRNDELILPRGTQTPVRPPEIQSPTNLGEQTNARTSSVDDSAADELDAEPIKNPSATGSGTAPVLTSTTMLTTSTAFMPSQGVAETVDLPSATPSVVAEESTSEVSDVEMSDLEAIDEILEAVKPRREGPLPSGSEFPMPGAVDGVRAKWEELCLLTEEGYSQIASNSSVEDRIKNLLAELSSGNDREEFATFFANGVESFKQNREKIESSTAVKENFNKLEDRLEAGKKILKERRTSFQSAVNKKDELAEEKERLEALLAEVKHQIELNHVDVRREGKSLKRQFREVDVTKQECDRQQAEVDRHSSIKRKCIEDNRTLDERLSTFRRNVKRRLDDMQI